MLKTLSTALLFALLTFGQAWVLPAYSALQTSPLVASSRFVSDAGQVLHTEYFDDDSVRLSWPDGHQSRLRLAISASGVRYTDGALEWWEHQGEGTLRDGERVVFLGLQQR
jgi:membrane-bound inhibitor of C-type lysozyme